jgi:hypothetical protein
MDETNSLSSQQNSRIIFNNIASGNYTIQDYSGDFLLTIPPGKTYEFIPISNTNNLPSGQWAWIDLSFIYSSTPPVNVTNGVVSMPKADASNDGYLDNNDWIAFNNKQPAGNYITALTGDGTASGAGSAALTLSTVNSNVGSFGSASSVSSLTVNAKGLITAASNTSIQIGESQVTNLVSDLAGKQATGNYITALTGDVTATGPGSVAATIANSAVTNAKLDNMAAHTFKMNSTASSAAPSDASITTVLSELSLNITANRIPYGNGSSGLTSSANLTFDGTDITNSAGGIKLQTTGGTPAALNYYEVGTFTVNFSGVATISNKTVNFIRNGKEVRLFFSGSQPAAAAASFFNTGSGAIPSRLRPATGLDYDGQCWVMDNSAWQTTPGRAIALSDGTIQIYKLNTSTNFTNSGNAGFGNVYMNYITS